MSTSRAELLLTITPGQGADLQELGELTRQLRTAVLESDADTVEPIRGSAAPAGAKGDPVTLGALAVMIAPKAVEGLIQIIQNWLSRHERATITVKSGDVELTVTGEPSAEQQQVTASFLAHLKH
jgi:hypothetical protein